MPEFVALFPYDGTLPVSLPDLGIRDYAEQFQTHLRARLCFGKTAEERGMKWWEYAMVMWSKRATPLRLGFSQIATHGHFVLASDEVVFKEKAPIIKLPDTATNVDYHLAAALLNSSAALFWLKQVCFNKGAGEDEHRDRFEYAGGKVQQLPVPEVVAKALRGQKHPLAERLIELSRECWERGRHLPLLALKKLFEKPGEAYYEWNISLPGYVAPHVDIAKPFETVDDLRTVFNRAVTACETLRAEMIARQEEMDWLVYAAYGLVADGSLWMSEDTWSLTRDQRPFCLWAQAEGDFDKAGLLIPRDWSSDRRSLWQARLAAIRDNEHIRRIEQPVYKRRWDEQWKVGGSWTCGDSAYVAEFRDALRWWLAEKAEWYVEKKTRGGPISLESWTHAIESDLRVRAAFEVYGEMDINGVRDERPFAKVFKEIVDGETVPEGIPPAVPWEELEKKGVTVPTKVRAIRGKLNVPRERFRLRGKDEYLWAGLEWKEGKT